MRGAEIPGPAGAVPAPNGTQRPVKTRNRTDAARTETGPPEAPFAAIDSAPADAPTWPLLPAAWLQPELVPSAPAWSGLAIERHHRVPAPGFVFEEGIAANATSNPEAARLELTSCIKPGIPESGLNPLGWDPRAFRKKEGCE